MRKAKLLSTVAAALLLSAGAASAQGMSKDNPERAPAAQQNAPAEKVAPPIKGSEQKATPDKAPQTTGQATPDAKSDAKPGKAKETTGQAPKSDVDEKAQTPSRSMDKDSKSGADTKSGVDTKAGADTKSGATTGQGAAGPAKLSTEQRTKITSVIRQQKVERTTLNVSVSIGTRIPGNVRFHSLPQEVFVIYPEWRGYDYILVGDQIVVVDPRTHEIVAILEA